MALYHKNGSLCGEMVQLVNHPLLRSLLFGNKLASNYLVPVDCSGRNHRKNSRGKKLSKDCLQNSTVDATVFFESFPKVTLQPPIFSDGNLGIKIPRASFNFTIKVKSKFGGVGDSDGQFFYPHGFCLGPDDEIVVADSRNHRIQVFDKNGNFKYKFGIAGKEDGCFWYPRKIALNPRSLSYVVGDKGPERSRLQVFSLLGRFVRRIAVPFIEILAGLAVARNGLIVAVDSVSPTVYIIHPNGFLLHLFNCGYAVLEPSEVALSGSQILVCDFKAHCVVVFSESGDLLRRFGGPSLTNFPNGIALAPGGQVLVGDSHGNYFHLVAFSAAGDLLVEFECPTFKVSRCCGLKVTREGYVVTVAKNNHHMIVTEPLCDVREKIGVVV